MLTGVYLRSLVVGAVTFGTAVALASFLGTESYLVLVIGSLLSLALHAGLGLRLVLTRNERATLKRVIQKRLGRAPSDPRPGEDRTDGGA
jgi:hypothetical protein